MRRSTEPLPRAGGCLPQGRSGVVVVAGIGQTLQGRRRFPVTAEPKRQGHPGVQRRRIAGRGLERATQHAQGGLGVDEAPGEIELQPQLATAVGLGVGQPLELQRRQLGGPADEAREPLLRDRGSGVAAAGVGALDRRQRLAPPPKLPLENLRLRAVSRPLVGRIGQRLPQAPQGGRELFAPAEPFQQAHVLRDGLDVGRIEGQRPRRGAQRLVGAPETERVQTRRLHLEAAGAGRIRLSPLVRERSPVAKFLSGPEIEDMNRRLDAGPGDLLLIVADTARRPRPRPSGRCGWSWPAALT